MSAGTGRARGFLFAGVALLAAGLLWLAAGAGEKRGSIEGAAARLELPGESEPAMAELASAPVRRAGVAPPDPAVEREPELELPAATSPAARGPEPVRGRVLDATGQGLPGVSIAKAGGLFIGGLGGLGPEIAVSGAGGSFEVELELGLGGARLESARGSGFATLRAARVTPENAGHEQLLVVAPAVELAGRVAERGGPALAGARVRFEIPAEAFGGFPEVLDRTVIPEFETLSGDEGRFLLPSVPAAEGARLDVRLQGFRSASLPAPAESTDDLWIELERLAEGAPWLQGVVVHADGTPAGGARVRLDSLATVAGADGGFGLEQGWADPDAPLAAALAGFQPAVLPRWGELMQGESPPPFARLVLGGPTLAIRGRILDAQGEACYGWEVALYDGTAITRNRAPPELAEDLGRGKPGRTMSAKDGSFELTGLLARDYVVQAHQRRTLLHLRSAPVAAGTEDLVLRVPADPFVSVAGVVVARDGAPLAGAHVGSRLVTARSGRAVSFQEGPSATTDADGRFRIERFPRGDASLAVDGEGVIPEHFELDPAREEQRLEVARRCHLRVELGETSGALPPDEVPDSIEALDAEGASVQLYTFQGNGSWSSSSHVALSRLGTHPLGLSEDARTLVFLREYVELWRAPLTLAPGEIAVARARR